MVASTTGWMVQDPALFPRALRCNCTTLLKWYHITMREEDCHTPLIPRHDFTFASQGIMQERHKLD